MADKSITAGRWQKENLSCSLQAGPTCNLSGSELCCSAVCLIFCFSNFSLIVPQQAVATSQDQYLQFLNTFPTFACLHCSTESHTDTQPAQPLQSNFSSWNLCSANWRLSVLLLIKQTWRKSASCIATRSTCELENMQTCVCFENVPWLPRHQPQPTQ